MNSREEIGEIICRLRNWKNLRFTKNPSIFTMKSRG